EHALPLAISIARRSGAGLVLAHVHTSLAAVYPESGVPYDEDLDAVLRRREEDYLAKVVQRIREVSPVQVNSVLLEGPIAAALEQRAAAVEADLLVMTTHGRGPLVRSWLGSVADELVRRAPVPVLVVRPHEARLDLAQEVSLRRMLIALDGSELS